MRTPLGRYAGSLLIRVVTTCLLSVSGALADGGDPPGHLDLAALGFRPQAEPAVDLVIGTAELAVAALAAQATDPDLAALLRNVEAFSLQQFSPPDPETLAAASALPAAMLTEGWQLVQAESQGSRQVTVYVKTEGILIAGLTVIAVDAGREVSVAHVRGNIQPSQLATLGLPIP